MSVCVSSVRLLACLSVRPWFYYNFFILRWLGDFRTPTPRRLTISLGLAAMFFFLSPFLYCNREFLEDGVVEEEGANKREVEFLSRWWDHGWMLLGHQAVWGNKIKEKRERETQKGFFFLPNWHPRNRWRKGILRKSVDDFERGNIFSSIENSAHFFLVSQDVKNNSQVGSIFPEIYREQQFISWVYFFFAMFFFSVNHCVLKKSSSNYIPANPD